MFDSLHEAVDKTAILLLNNFYCQIPDYLQEFEDILHGATCWLEEAQSWLSAPCSFPTARGLHHHASSLQVSDAEQQANKHKTTSVVFFEEILQTLIYSFSVTQQTLSTLAVRSLTTPSSNSY